MVDSVINGFFRNGIPRRHTRFLLHRQILGLLTAVWIRIIIQSVLLADTVGDLTEFEPRLFISPQMLTVYKGNGIDNKVAVQVLGIQMCRNNYLKAFAPNLFGKFHSDMLRHLRRNIGFLKAQISVIGLYALRLLVLLLDRYKLVTGNRHITVDSLHIKFPFRLFFVFRISQHIGKRLILLRRKMAFNLCGGFFRIGSIINNLTEPLRYRPQLGYCHFISLLSGRRKYRSTSD